MKNKHLAILSAFLLMVIVSIACIRSSRTVSTLKFEPNALPASQMGTPYETEIHISQNDTPVIDFLISKGALPAGLELVKVEGENTAKISGLPQETGTFTFTISVRCYGTSVNGQTGEKEYSIVVER